MLMTEPLPGVPRLSYDVHCKDLEEGRSGTAFNSGTATFFWCAGLIVLLAAAFRFWDLSSAPLWIDEAFTVLAARFPLSSILFNEIDYHPPLVYALQHLWMKLSSALSLTRVPAAMAGTLTVLIVIASTADLLSRRAALWAGLLVAVSTGHIYFSQDARMYPFVVLGLALASWGLVGSISPDKSRPWTYVGLYVFGSTISIYSHFIGLVYLAAINVAGAGVLLVQGLGRRYFARWLAMNVFVALLSIPWLLQVFSTAGTFPGLGDVDTDPQVVAFFVRNAVGYAGLPRLFDIPVLILLIGSAVSGSLVAWRAKRPAFALVGLAGLLLYPAMILGLNLKTQILAARVFLPLVIPVASLAGAMLSAPIVPRLSWPVGAMLIILGLWASVSEHLGRTKHDNPKAALGAAAMAGYAGAPVITCHFFDAAAVLLSAEELNMKNVRILTFQGDYVLRFDERHFAVVNMSMARFLGSSASDVDAYLGGGYVYAGGLAEAVRDERRVALIFDGCETSREQFIARLSSLGYTIRHRQLFQREGRVVMEKGQSELLLFER
jgi:4-amino-4-deoxy-L-arabinose transferase-like glycosyltransferase